MSDTRRVGDRASYVFLPADGDPISSGQDVLALLFGSEADWIAVPVARLDPRFFDLSRGVAGDITQKFVNYRARLAVVGDISQQLSASAALRDFVKECNRGTSIWFVADEAELRERLAVAAS